MTDSRDDDFRVRPSAPKNRGKGQGQSFVSKVLKQAGKANHDIQTERQKNIQNRQIGNTHPGLTAHAQHKRQGD